MEEVKLITKEIVNGETVQKTQTFEIEEISFEQFARLLNVVKKTFKELQEDGGMNEFMQEMFGSDSKIVIDESTPQEIIDELDEQFFVKLLGGLEFIAGVLPNRFIEIIATISDIEKEILQKQKLLKVMDVYDAVIEANDIELLVERVKKSMRVTMIKMKLMGKVKQATQE